MRKLCVALLVLLTMCSFSYGQSIRTSLGIQPIFVKSTTNFIQGSGTDIHFNDNLGIDRKSTVWELYGGASLGSVSVRGYWLLPKSYSGVGNLVKSQYDPASTSKDEKLLPATLDRNFRTSRIELGFPLYYQSFILEPMFVNTWVTDSFNINADKFKVDKTFTSSNSGLGIAGTWRVNQWSVISSKWFRAANDDYFDIKYRGFNSRYFAGAGYTYRTFNIGLQSSSLVTVSSGFTMEAGLTF